MNWCGGVVVWWVMQFTKDALQGKPVKIKLLSMDQVRNLCFACCCLV